MPPASLPAKADFEEKGSSHFGRKSMFACPRLVSPYVFRVWDFVQRKKKNWTMSHFGDELFICEVEQNLE